MTKVEWKSVSYDGGADGKKRPDMYVLDVTRLIRIVLHRLKDKNGWYMTSSHAMIVGQFVVDSEDLEKAKAMAVGKLRSRLREVAIEISAALSKL